MFVSRWRGWLNLSTTDQHKIQVKDAGRSAAPKNNEIMTPVTGSCKEIIYIYTPALIDSQIQTFFSLIMTFVVKVFRQLRGLNFLWQVDINLHHSATPKLIWSTFLTVQLLALINVTWLLIWHLHTCWYGKMNIEMKMKSLSCVMLPSLPKRGKASGSLCVCPGYIKHPLSVSGLIYCVICSFHQMDYYIRCIMTHSKTPRSLVLLSLDGRTQEPSTKFYHV